MSKNLSEGFELLFQKAGALVESTRNAVGSVANMLIVYTNYQIGKYIVEEEQNGADRAAYGAKIIDSLSEYLTNNYGRGFSRSNVASMRQFYLVYKERDSQIVQSGIGQLPDLQNSGIVQSPIGQLTIKGNWPFLVSWTHYQILMRIENDDERTFYEQEAYRSAWSVKMLKRQYNSSLYERIALSRDKEDVMRLANEGNVPYEPKDILHTPYVLEFSGLEDKAAYHESDLENAILSKMQDFMLEMGKGFLFEKRQRRFVFNEKNYYLDLVLYNRYLQCYVLIDFKIDELTHQDLGQMQMYVNYYDRYEKTENERPTIGILMCKESDQELVELTLPENSNIYAQEYKLYLPDKKLLQEKLREWVEEEENK
ncbi:PDDEXK nuclease domain-containing protein [Pseudobutyrivibrio ruminis]|uniref:PDDEXK nuclease domain-containing protein n=1 Tax=Pseudobutyrivibrio ruminis TaxID=46206 RepID=UPI00051B915C|nr:PDDEXK nuclease domain-containing protein [Pseudobutyrivibrio ruminis]